MQMIFQKAANTEHQGPYKTFQLHQKLKTISTKTAYEQYLEKTPIIQHQLFQKPQDHKISSPAKQGSFVPAVKKRKYKRKGNWGIDEQAKYYLFVTQFLMNFATSQTRKMEKIFKRMSEFIGSRTSAQCRSHHQKHKNKSQRWDVLLQNLYLLAKSHPLLEHQPVFCKDDPHYQQFFVRIEELLKNQAKRDPIAIFPDAPEVDHMKNIEQQLVCFKMPDFPQPISEKQYLQLVHSLQKEGLTKQQ